MDGSSLFSYLVMGLVVWGIAGLYRLFVSRSESRGIDRSYRERLPLRKRLARRFGTRKVSEFEWSARFTEAPPALEITFFVERLPTAFDLELPASTRLPIEGLRYRRLLDPACRHLLFDERLRKLLGRHDFGVHEHGLIDRRRTRRLMSRGGRRAKHHRSRLRRRRRSGSSLRRHRSRGTDESRCWR